MTFDQFSKTYLSRLDENQRQAVTTVNGPVLVLAVPGSGKTTALVHRVGYMALCENIPPENILTLTYTVAATKEMKERFLSLFGEEYRERVSFRTINGICASMIKHYATLEGKTAFRLLDSEKEAPRIVADILRDLYDEYPTEAEVKDMITLIAYCKNMLFSAEEIREKAEEWDVPIYEAYSRYQKYLRSQSLMDYDDQLIYAYNMLRRSPDFLAYYRNHFRYVLVDEAQDTSKVQHEIIKLLVGETGNVFMVGDEDQSIYGFRAAYPEALLNFSKDYPGAKIIVMNRNYRSNANIVVAAERLIKHNKNRYDKNMIATKKAYSDIRILEAKSRVYQYGYLLKVASDCTQETAVLYRDNECALPLIDRLDRQSIPFYIRNMDFVFFTNRIVRDIVNIFRLAIDPYDSEAFMQVYYRGFLPMNKDEAKWVCDISNEHKCSIVETLANTHYSYVYQAKRSHAFATNLWKMRTETPSKALFRIRKAMGYDDYLEENSVGDGKLRILEMLAYNENTLESFIERLEYLRDMIQNFSQENKSPFILSTIHSAKGLEFDNVFLIDVFDGEIPSTSVLNGIGVSSGLNGMEEERRLFYVGVTRAKKSLSIFEIKDDPSTFLNELVPLEERKALEEKRQRELSEIDAFFAPAIRESVEPVFRKAEEKKQPRQEKVIVKPLAPPKESREVKAQTKSSGSQMRVYELDGEKYYYSNGKWLTSSWTTAPTAKVSRLNKFLLQEINLDDKTISELIQIIDGAKNSGNTVLAIKAGKLALEKADRIEIRKLLSRITSTFRMLGQPQAAIETAKRYMDILGREVWSPMLFTSLAAAYCDLGKTNEARAYANRARSLSGGNSSPELISVYSRLKSMD